MTHIFLAEDNPGDVMLVKTALQEYHVQHVLHVVQDGAKALDLFVQMGKPGGTPYPDLMLLDLNLPKVKGAEVLGEFRKHPECSQTPVIVVTSSDAETDRRRMAELGIAHYFCKPSDFESFMNLGAIVKTVLLQHASGLP
jgi:chemotaxis family two-component system response regulator Rcp1